MKIGKFIVSIGLTLSLANNCFAVPGEVESSIDTVGGKLELISVDENKCFDCYPHHLVLDKKITVFKGDRIDIQKIVRISSDKDWLLINSTCSGNRCGEAINTILEISKNKKHQSVGIDEFRDYDIENYLIFKQGDNIIIQEKDGWKITISPNLKILKKEISYPSSTSNISRKEIKKFEDLKGEPGSSMFELPIIKKDLQRLGLEYLEGGYSEVEFEDNIASSISFKETRPGFEYSPSEVIWADNKNNYFILLESGGYAADFLIVSNLKYSNILETTKKYLSDGDFQWRIAEKSKCYINSDTRSIPCKKILEN